MPSHARPGSSGSSSNHSNSISMYKRYLEKYKQLKCAVKDMIFLNSAICDEVVRMEEKVAQSKEERRYLVRRLLQNEAEFEGLSLPLSLPLTHPPPLSQVVGSLGTKPTTQSIAQILGEVDRKKRKSAMSAVGNGPPKKKAKDTPPGVTGGVSVEDSLKSKVVAASKKSKASVKRLVQPIPLDNLGRPIFPIELGNLTVYCLGEIVPEKSEFNTIEHIYPAGFCSTRIYCSTQLANQVCLYTCKIIDDGDQPLFEISAEDNPDIVFMGDSCDECHIQLLQAVNVCRALDISLSDEKGAEFFGITHPTIQNLLQSCPGARKCTTYKWVKFEVSRTGMTNYVEDLPSVNVDLLMNLDPAALEAAAKGTSDVGSSSLRNLLTDAQFSG